MFANFQTLIPLLAVVQLATGQTEQLAGVAGLGQEKVQNHDVEESSLFARLRDFYGGSAIPNLLQPDFKGEDVKDTANEESNVYGLDQYYAGNRRHLNTQRELEDYDYDEPPVDCVGKGKGKGGCTCMSMSYDYSKGKGGSDDYSGKGKNGSKGSKGKDGSKGSEGKDGSKGSKGKDGSKGSEGKDGSKGSKGKDGSKGSEGKDGSKGSKGKDGSKGSEGKDGSKGSKGKDGGKGMSSEYELDYTYRERRLSAVESSAQDGGVHDSTGTYLRSGTSAAGTDGHIERRDEYDDYQDNEYPDGGSPSKGDSGKGKGSKGESSKGSKGKGDISKGSKGESSKGKGHDDDCVCEEDYDGKGKGKGSKGDSSKGSKGKGSKGDSSKGADYGKGDDECDICPPGDLNYVFEPMRLTWPQHLARVGGIEGCYFAAIRNEDEQEEVQDLIVEILFDSGRDFVYLGGQICGGSVSRTDRGTDGQPIRGEVTDSEWCWVDFPELAPFGAGSPANENAPGRGYQNWGDDGLGTYPNNLRGVQGQYMGLYTAAVRPTLQFTWDDQHRSWPAIYECCPGYEP